MAKSGNFGMACHQALSFHRMMLRVPKAEAIFWPGCALMNLDQHILEQTLVILRRAEPEIQLATGCCGQPTVYLFPKREEARKGKLRRLLCRQKVRRIYTACPNCTLQLRQLGDCEILPIWPVLAAYLDRGDIKTPEGSFIWHDPCPTRKDMAQLKAVRELLTINGCNCRQPEHTGKNTRCCGNICMLRATDPAKSARMRKSRLEELDADRIILSSCEGCLDAFRSEGRDTCHLLELLFGRSKARGWGNRIRTTLKTPID